jgi:flavin reductase (DIM6/NTAB) family NADH-FMN oxidoreductase RutF
MKIKVPLKKANRLINHGPTILVSSLYKGRPNVCPVAWNMPVDFDPPKVACVIGEDNYSFECVRRTKEFVINVPTKKILKKVIQCGSTSGEDTDKFRAFGLRPMASSRVKAPLIKECIAHLECKLLDTAMADKYNIFLGKVVAAWVEKGFFKDMRLLVEKEGAKTIHHLGARYFTFPSRVTDFKS